MLPLLFFIVAILYSSVGHGGASGYLALMGLWDVAPELMRPTALTLNIIVSGMGMVLFYQGGHLKGKWLIYLLLGSFPMAMIGASWELEASLYRKILGIILLLAAVNIFLRLWMKRKNTSAIIDLGAPKVWKFFISGSAIGLLSGLIGIGGGILLSPLLLFAGWADARQTAAISAPFIFANSIGGLAVILYNGTQFIPEMPRLILAVILGGFLGAYMGSFKLKESFVRGLLGAVLFIAGMKLVIL